MERMYLAKTLSVKRSYLEILVWCLAIATQLFVFRKLLWGPAVTFTHDAYAWSVPVLEYVTRNLWRGEFPLWNPYSHAGDPFYPLLIQFRLLDPVVLFLLWVFQFFTKEPLLAVHWNRYLLHLLMMVGTYLWLRRFTKKDLIRLTLIPLLLFSPFFWTQFHQDGFLNQFLWFPFLLIFLTNALERKRITWSTVFGTSLFIGLSLQSYFFTGMITVLTTGVCGLLLYYPEYRAGLFSKKFWIKVFALFILLGGLSLPNISILKTQKDLVFPLRVSEPFEGLFGGERWLKQGVKNPLLEEKSVSSVDYPSVERTGAFLIAWDIVRAFTAEKNYFYAGKYPVWGHSSEAYLFLGCFSLILIFLGFTAGKHPFKKLFLFILILTTIFALGPRGFLHRLIFSIYPPFWFTRNMEGLVYFIYTFLLFFYVLGFEVFLKISLREVFSIRNIKKSLPLIFGIGISLGLAPAFKAETYWFALFPIFITYRVASYYSKKIDWKMVFVSLVLGHAIAVLITLGFNAPNRYLPVIFYWIVVLGIPFLSSKIASVVIIGEILYVFLTSTWGIPIADSVKPVLLGNRISSYEHRKLLPKHSTGCTEDWSHCLQYVSLLEEKRYMFPDVNIQKPNEPHYDSPSWIRKQNLFPSLLLKKDYVRTVLADLEDKKLNELFAIEEIPFNCKESVCEFQLFDWKPDKIVLTIRSLKPTQVYWSEGYSKDWELKINSVLSELAPSDINFSSFTISKGLYAIELKFKPRFFIMSLWIYYFILVNAVIVIAVAPILTARRIRSI